MTAIIVLVVIIAIIAIYSIVIYNSLVKYRNWIEESFKQIDVQLNRRYELIPNLIELVKGYIDHEHKTLVDVINARSKINVGTPEERVQADNQLQSTLRSLYRVTEDYPELQAQKEFQDVRDELISTENKVTNARGLYNRTAAEYNIKREKFPTVIFASILGFQKQELLEFPEETREPVRVKF
ncbi:MAG TPA: LemA family protein [Bacillota bacterium]|nr:LemA family protein [Bacillota bacterium]